MKLIISLLLVICISYVNVNEISIQEDEFISLIKSKGAAEAIEYYKDFRKKNPDAILFKRETINNLGWLTAEKGDIDEAIKLFELNILAYPDHYDPWDSYGEAILIRGGINYIDKAIKNFEKSLELNPDNTNAAQRLLVLKNYSEHEYMIPMRDGVKLFTQVYVPNDTSKEYPILFKREWYGIDNYGPEYRRVLHRNELLAKEGLIFVFQDIRGRFMSEGDFKVLRPFNRNKVYGRDIDESTDAYDTIEWLLKNLKGNNGKVGIHGGSYSGWAALMAAIDSHPAVKAIFVAASPADWWMGDDIHHNGAFRLMYAYSWVGHDAWPRANGPTSKSPSWPGYTTNDGYGFFLDIGPISNVNEKYFKNENPTWNEYMQHGNYDEYWENLNILQYLKNIKVPVLNIIGWFDAEDYRGPLMIYKTIEKNNPDIFNSVVIGPWRHGGWHNSTGENLGDINFGSETSEFFQSKIEFPFFMHFLKDSNGLYIPEAYVFLTGANQWKEYDTWPPNNIKEKRLYLDDRGKLAFTPDYENEDFLYDEFISDPDNPVPWSEEKQTQQGHTWMISDQRFASKRQDVLVFKTELLEEDITIAGPIIAHLSFSTTGTDADWIVKIIDVYPEDAEGIEGGYQMLLAGDVFRSKYRNSLEMPEPLVPDEITEVEFNLYDKFHTFKKGHRIMVQVQSTWFPVIDRNPQTFCNIYEAEEADFQKAIHRVYHTVTNESFISLYIMQNE
jgi:putative CocE/NonD family hydrolase